MVPILVASLVSLTVALAMTAPVESVTVPCNAPSPAVCAWTCIVVQPKLRARVNSRERIPIPVFLRQEGDGLELRNLFIVVRLWSLQLKGE